MVPNAHRTCASRHAPTHELIRPGGGAATSCRCARPAVADCEGCGLADCRRCAMRVIVKDHCRHCTILGLYLAWCAACVHDARGSLLGLGPPTAAAREYHPPPPCSLTDCRRTLQAGGGGAAAARSTPRGLAGIARPRPVATHYFYMGEYGCGAQNAAGTGGCDSRVGRG